MARHWTPLPASLSAAHAALVTELRHLKDQSGLSLSRLAAQTNYSRSSWERWLNGKRPIPRVAVERVAVVCGVEPAELLARWRRQNSPAQSDLGRAAAGPGAVANHPVQRSRPGTPESAGAGHATGPATAPPPAPSAPAPPVLPRQLPCAPRHFVGRDDALRELAEVFERRRNTYGATTVLALDGTAGIGKTALAIRWAHQVAEQFPDGQLYTNLRGFDPTNSPMTPVEAIRGFLSAFQVPPEAIPADLDAQTALYRSLLSDKRILLVLDNARDAEQVRPLLPGSATCLTVVTSRSRLTGLAAVEGAHLMPLYLLSNSEAHQLLIAHIGPEQAEAQSAAVDELITRCAGLPLALSIVGARSAAQPNFPLSAIADELRETETLMNALNSGDAIADVRTVFSWSYRCLSAPAARLFRLLGTHPGPDISIPAAASMAGVPAEEARQALSELTRANLLDEHAPGRFAFHDLLRAYAGEQASLLDSDAERCDATHRMLDHYLHTASAAVLLLAPARAPLLVPPPRTGMIPEDLTDYNSALQWFDVERPTLLAAIELAAQSEFDVHAWQIACALATFLERRTHWHDWLTSERTALAAAERVGDLDGQARTRRGLSRACIRFGLYDEAREHLRLALALYRQLDDASGQGQVHLDLGRSFDCLRAYHEALAHATRALRLFDDHGQRADQANALNSIGAYHALLGNRQVGLAHCERALAVYRDLGHAYGQAETWDNLGSIHQQLGQQHKAIGCYRQAIELFAELGDRHNQAAALTRLGDVQRAAGNADSAHTAWEHALAILNDLHHPTVDDVRIRLRRDLSRPRRLLSQTRSGPPRPGVATATASATAAATNTVADRLGLTGVTAGGYEPHDPAQPDPCI